MAQARHAPPLRIELKASRLLTAALVVVHVTAAAAVLAAVAQWQWRLAAAAVLAVSAWQTLWRYGMLRDPRSVIALELSGECGCAIAYRDGRIDSCAVCASTYVAAWLIVLDLAQAGSRLRRHVVVAPDSTTPEAWRRLRVRLRWSRPHAGADAAADPSL